MEIYMSLGKIQSEHGLGSNRKTDPTQTSQTGLAGFKFQSRVISNGLGFAGLQTTKKLLNPTG
jgi:hypothetical protein